MGKYVLDINRRGRQLEISGLHVGDNGFRSYEFTFAKGGEILTFSVDCIATLYATLPDGTSAFSTCKIEGNTVIYDLVGGNGEETGLTSLPGKCDCEIRLFTSDGEVLTCPKFSVWVDGTLQNDDAIEAQPSFSALTDALSRVLEAETGLDSKVDKTEGTEGNLVVFGEGGALADGGAPSHMYTIPFYASPTSVQQKEIAGIVNEIKADGGKYSVCLLISALYRVPAVVAVSSRGTSFVTGILYYSDSATPIKYTVSVTNAGVVSTKSEALSTASGSAGKDGKDGKDGEDGEDGATFTPSVSADGIISWTNDKGRANPASVNIMGPQGMQGAKGETGAQGPRGEKGETGAQGPKGDTGATGATGSQGPAGSDATVTATNIKSALGYTPATQAEVEQLSEKIADLKGAKIPDYWQTHLAEKIATIKTLQETGGKDCFSFIVITDMHYESNLGKISPTLAKKIADECGIKFVLCLGDSQTRHGANHDETYIDSEWSSIEEMLSPVRDRLLITQGNHDGSYDIIDLNSDGAADDINADGVVDSYDKNVYNWTPQKLYENIFRKVSTIDNVHFSSDGTGYYVDDTGNKVRYIILNTHVNKWNTNSDGSMKYNNMYNFRFGQPQYNMVIEALTSIPDDDCSVIIASHVPLDRSGEYVAWGGQVDDNGALLGTSIADCTIMQRLLNAYVNKTKYSGSFAGTQGSGAGYVNQADTSNSDWAMDSRLDSSGNVTTGTGCVSNYIEFALGDIITISNASINTSNRWVIYDSTKTQLYLGAGSSLSSWITTEDDVIYFDTSKIEDVTATAKNAVYIRLPLTLVDGTIPIITTGDISASSDNFDLVNINVDFTNAKGTVIAYFGGHIHKDLTWNTSYSWNGAEHSDFNIISTRCDGNEENDETLHAERVPGTITEQSFDVVTVNKAEKKIYATKIGAGADRTIRY